MIGDQIYADDVADPLALILYKLGKYLMGREEDLSRIDNSLAGDLSIYQIGGRTKVMKDYCGFTSKNSGNHMMSVGEYATMYLCSWSPELLEMAYKENYLESFNLLLSKERFHETLLESGRKL